MMSCVLGNVMTTCTRPAGSSASSCVGVSCGYGLTRVDNDGGRNSISTEDVGSRSSIREGNAEERECEESEEDRRRDDDRATVACEADGWDEEQKGESRSADEDEAERFVMVTRST